MASENASPAASAAEQDRPPGALRLLVGTIFVDASELQRKWFDLQLQFLSKTTAHFEHATVMSDSSTPAAFWDRTEILQSDRDDRVSNVAHVYGLERLLAYFRSRAEEFDYFLFLDSDAFPVRSGWLDILDRRLNGRYEIAAALRPENLETRLHASIVLAKREALPHLSFEVGEAGRDLAWNVESDVLIRAYQFERREKAFPLLRSNRFSLHPLLCGIYYDLFYHNDCGSGRAFIMRAQSYWNHMEDERCDPLPWIEELISDPATFISRLTQHGE